MAEVLAANDIVEIIGAAVELKPAGANRFKGLCPFHTEKTPSFTVSRDTQLFYCFGCQAGGDAIAFLRNYDNLSFVDALRRLAERGGVSIPEDFSSKRDDGRRKTLLDAAAAARDFFRGVLRDPARGARARDYLESRQLRPETTELFGLGYAPASWSGLTTTLQKKGYDQATLVQAGLVRSGNQGAYDFFRDRLMFPIRDISGQVVAFGGRDLSDDSPAKYINTPEGPAYKKSKVLYGLYEARDTLRKERCAVLVEGYFDVLRCFDAGLPCAVAPCGTAFTAEQAHLLRRHVPEAVLVFDGDRAGVNAALRAIAVLVAAGLTVRAVALPEGQDPDDYIKGQGVEAFRTHIREAPDFVTFFVEHSADRLQTIEGRTEVAKEMFGILHGMNDPLRLEEYLKLLAQRLQMDPWRIRNEYEKLVRGRRTPESREKRADAVQATFRPLRVNPDDCAFLAAILGHPQAREEARAALADVPLENGPLAEALSLVLASDRAANVFQQLESEGARQLLAEASNRIEPWETAEPVFRPRLAQLQRQPLHAEAARIQECLREAERSNDTARILELVARKNHIDKEIRRPLPSAGTGAR